jgi:CheY-like chemotaxis protein
VAARVLLIEDNPPSMDLMCYLLEHFGHSPIRARDGLSGLEAMRTERPDLVICDIDLPRLDGYTLAARAKADAELRAIPLIAVTALAMVGDRDRAIRAGFDGYLPKPIEPETFVRDVEQFLPRREDLPADRGEA